MGFYIYKVKGNEAVKVRKVKFAGYGLIYQILKHKNITNPGGRGVGWHITDKELISASGLPANESYMFVIDLKSNVKDNVSLYKLENVWGYSYGYRGDSNDYKLEGWTPLMLQLIPIFIDEPPNEVNKEKFILPADLNNREKIYTFPYLKGGIFEDKLAGDWNWGWGNINAALLWPQALEFFMKSIQFCENLKEVGHVQ